MSGIKDKIISLFEANESKKSPYGGRKRSKKQSKDKIIKIIEDKIIRDIRNIFEQEEVYYKSGRVGKFHNNSCIQYKSNADRNKTISIKEYLDETKPFLKVIINKLKKSDTWRIQSTVAINSASSNNTDEKCVMHSKHRA